MQQRVYDMLAIQREYSKISNDQHPGDSLEAVHNLVHNILGGGGHMTNLAYSAFDPVFWLHHAYVTILEAKV
jgi:tyrosinase